jgi:hypothetical protein
MGTIKQYTYVKLDDLCNSFSESCLKFQLYQLAPAVDWFSMASRIGSIDYNIWKYNTSMGLCEVADEYDEERGKVDKAVVESLVIFTLLWSGLEALISILNLTSHPRFAGKINAATYLIKEKLEQEKFCKCAYLNLVKKLEEFLIESEIELPQFKNQDAFSSLGEGIQIVYQIRNNFAHGSFTFPEPQEWNSRNVVEHKILKLASYITIVTAQFLILSYFKEDDLIAEDYDAETDQDVSIKLFDQFKMLHFEYIEAKENA